MIKDKALEIFEAHNPYGEALKNHCMRLAAFATALAAHEGFDVDEDLVYAGAYLHDIGLLVPKDNSKNYLHRGVAFAAPLFEVWGLDKDQQRQMRDMLLYNHSFRSVSGITPAGDVIRRGVQVEHSLGKWSHGLNKKIRNDVFAEYPRHGLNSVLADFVKMSVRRDGVGELFHLFFPTDSGIG